MSETTLGMIKQIADAGDELQFGYINALNPPLVSIRVHDSDIDFTIFWGNRREIARNPDLHSGSHGAALRVAFDQWLTYRKDHPS